MRTTNTGYALAVLAVAALATVTAGCGAVDIHAGTHEPGKSHSTVNGSVRVGADSEVEDVSSVNGSVKVGEAALVRDAETVNGSITLAERAGARNLSSVNGSIRGAEGVAISGDVETVNGSLRLASDSRIEGSVGTVNGRVELSGVTVAGNVESYNGSTELGQGTVVEGDLRYKKPKMGKSWGKGRLPKVVIGPQSEVRGELVFERPVELWVHESASIGPVSGAEAKSYSGSEPG